jgi:hypothetical protein
MKRHLAVVTVVAGFVAATFLACSQKSAPLAPTPASSSSNAPADAALKATAPSVISPINDAKLESTPVTLSAGPATLTFASGTPQYRFQLFNAAGTLVEDSGLISGTSYQVKATLDFDAKYTWRSRAEMGGDAGPWSAIASFSSPQGGYIRGAEMFDPLTNGKTVGRAVGCTFIPGVGIRLDTQNSFVEYRLQAPLTDGEFSAIMTNLGNGSEEWKTKVMSMLQGDGVNVTDNDFRVTLDKRTTWVGQGSPIRYTMRSRGVDSGEPNAGPTTWDRSHLYFWQFTWRGGQSRLIVRDGGVNGSQKANIGVSYKAPYSPNPHIIRLGSVGGRGGDDTNPGTIVRNVWVSANPRPVFKDDNP